MTTSPRALEQADYNLIVGVLTRQANDHPVSPQAFFKDLVRSADLSDAFRSQVSGVWTGAADIDAGTLVTWAAGKGGNPQAPGYTTLGSLIVRLLPKLGIEDGRLMAAEVLAYSLYRDETLQRDLMDRYHVPYPAGVGVRAMKAPATILEPGPNFEWRGTTDESELQSFFRPVPDILDVGFLIRAIEGAASVCEIELPASLGRQGTGFLIGKTLVLTNYHVLKYNPEEDLQMNATNAVLRFGKISTVAGQPALGHTFKLVTDQPIVKWSPVDQLDYVLLRVEDAITGVEEIKPALCTTQRPRKDMGLNIIQHPGGEEMKLALSSNGVVGVYPDQGLVQYVTQAWGGSSGSPCFTDDWQVIALHHAEKSLAFGLVREGITYEAIHAEIAQYL